MVSDDQKFGITVCWLTKDQNEPVYPQLYAHKTHKVIFFFLSSSLLIF